MLELDDSLIAALAGRYEIERELGRGGMAIVYLARDVKHGRRVALKVLRTELTSSIAAERFLEEIAIAAPLVHPNILAVHDSGEASGFLYYVMPYVEGLTLRQRLEREVQLPIDKACAIVRQVAAALDYAHERGVVHRDIKPENILLLGDHVLVADFGLAKAFSHARSSALTERNVVVGTPAYMSPEQCTTGAAVDARSDIYSLACVAFEMIAGIPPFRAATAQVLILHHQESDPPSLSRERRSCPEPLDAAVRRALAKIPADRFQSAGAFARALEAALATAPEHSPVPRGKPRSRWSFMARAIGATLLLVAAAVGLRKLVELSSGAGDALNPDLLAIAPFDVLDPRVAVWRTGIVSQLYRTFDGFGRLHTVAPSVSIREWSGEAGIDGAARLGERTKAQLVLVGSIVPAGPSSTRIQATLYDVASRRTLGEYDLRGDTLAVAALADSLTLSALRDLKAAGRIGAVHLRQPTLGAANMLALKAFFQAEEHYRSNKLAAAEAQCRLAIELDPAFALPYLRLRTIYRLRGENDSAAMENARLAGMRNHGLAPRDSVLVASGASLVRLRHTPITTPAWWALMRERFRLLDQLVREYPRDPEAWYELGEARYHANGAFGITAQQSLESFEKAIALDRAFAPAYFHAVELRTWSGQVAAARALALSYPVTREAAAVDSVARERRDVFQLAAELLNDEDASARPCRRADGPKIIRVLVGAVYLVRRMPGSDAPLRCFRDIAARFPDAWAADSEWVRQIEFGALLARGRPRAAFTLVRGSVPPGLEMLAEHAALLGALPADSARRMFDAWRGGGDSRLRILVLPWLRARRDRTALYALAHGPRRRQEAESALVVRESYVAAAASAQLALIAHDTSRAIALLGRATDSLCDWWCTPDRLLYAQLLDARGRAKEAAASLDRWAPPAGTPTVLESFWYLERARLAESLGQRGRAATDYGIVAATLQDPEPPLAACLAAARQGVLRTRAAPTAGSATTHPISWARWDPSTLACPSL